MSRFAVRTGVCAMFIATMAGCAMPAKKAGKPAAAAAPAAAAQAIACKPVGASPMIGTWYSAGKQAGIKGEMRRLLALQADGSYRLETRLQDGRNIRAELRETGCWETAGSTYTTQVTHSGGEPVDPADPIYRNSFRIEKMTASQMVYRENVTGAKSVTARKMPQGYRMP